MEVTYCYDVKLQHPRCRSIFIASRISKLWLPVIVLISLLVVLSYGEEASTNYKKLIKVGAIIDVDSRIGREEKTALDIAVQSFNNNDSTNHKLSLYIKDSGANPLLAATAAQRLIKENVEVIIGMDTWEEAVVVGDIGSRAQVPVLSFAESSITPPLATTRWPFLVRMANDDSQQMECIAAVVSSFNWKRVIVIYEDDAFGSEYSGKLALLSEALRDVGSEIEFRLVLPPFSSVANPNEVVQEDLMKLVKKQSRVFIVLHSSFSMTILLFENARKIGLVGTDSAWIVTESISSYLDSFNSSVISSMEGALGIKIYYSEDTSLYNEFCSKFRKIFRNEYHEEDNFQPGIKALRAYDSIGIITRAMEELKNSDESSPERLLKRIISSYLAGLSGEIRFEQGKLSHDPILRIVNVVGKRYKELDFWLPGIGFSTNPVKNNETVDFGRGVTWPGGPKLGVPKGWAMPTDMKPMIIGVPARATFEKFVKVEDGQYHGFCIDLFYKVLDVLGYDLPYRFHTHNGTYDQLVHKVYNKTYDAAVGDITILAYRADDVEFTQPYAESGLSMIVPAKSEDSTWIFLKPFTTEMWLVTAAILIYTMFIVWMLEHQSNPEFRGPWTNQIGTALWFTFSSLFFAHREKLYSNLTRVVVVVWLFVVLVLNSSYTASLTSMLTVKRLGPNIKDIEGIKRANLKIGCDGDPFVRTYLEKVLGFESFNIENVHHQYDYEEEFKSKHIAAAFLELPYAKVFLSQYCKQFTTSTPTNRFGGFGFVFQKGSPIARDVSRAILKLSEDGTLLSLEGKWFAPSLECSVDVTDDSRTDSLSTRSFWGLYLISGATSTLCLLFFLVHLLKKYYRHRVDGVDESVWIMAVQVAKYIFHGEASVAPDQAPDTNEGSNPSALDYDQIPTQANTENLNVSQAEAGIDVVSQAEAEIEMPLRTLS